MSSRPWLCALLLWALGPGQDAGAAEAEIPALVAVPAGSFLSGSDRAERDLAYDLDEAAYGHARTRQGRWYEGERARAPRRTGGFEITRTPITNAQYARFVADTGHRAPDVDAATWQDYRLVHPYERTRKFAWRDGKPPAGREDHPVVLVSHDEGAVQALEPERVLLRPDGVEDLWGRDYEDLIALA